MPQSTATGGNHVAATWPVHIVKAHHTLPTPVKLGLMHVLHTRDYYQHHLHTMVSGDGGAMTLHGGPVQHTPQIYLVFWGWQSSPDTTADPDGMQTYLEMFLTSASGSPYMNIDTQYFDNINGTPSNPNPLIAGEVFDSNYPPNPYGYSDVAAEALWAESYFGYNPDANYFVITPTTYTMSNQPGCAFHSTAQDSSGNTIAFTQFHYIPDSGGSCGAGNVNSPGTLDGVSIIAGHEQAETETDPQPGSGWVDSTGAEIGDKCAWTNDQNITFPNGGTFPAQPLWSNMQYYNNNSAYQSGCAFSY